MEIIRFELIPTVLETDMLPDYTIFPTVLSRFELEFSGSEPDVLPLHHRTTSVKRFERSSIRVRNPLPIQLDYTPISLFIY